MLEDHRRRMVARQGGDKRGKVFGAVYLGVGNENGACRGGISSGRAIRKDQRFYRGRFNFEAADSTVGDEEDYTVSYKMLTELGPDLGKQDLDILFMDALCLNMDRHTKNYGVLLDQTTGRVLCMAPNFDNNIALISRGYGADPSQTNDMLIRLFAELLEGENLDYRIPSLSMEVLSSAVSTVLPEEDIRRDYVVEMVWSRMQRLLRLHLD